MENAKMRDFSAAILIIWALSMGSCSCNMSDAEGTVADVPVQHGTNTMLAPEPEEPPSLDKHWRSDATGYWFPFHQESLVPADHLIASVTLEDEECPLRHTLAASLPPLQWGYNCTIESVHFLVAGEEIRKEHLCLLCSHIKEYVDQNGWWWKNESTELNIAEGDGWPGQNPDFYDEILQRAKEDRPSIQIVDIFIDWGFVDLDLRY